MHAGDRRRKGFLQGINCLSICTRRPRRTGSFSSANKTSSGAKAAAFSSNSVARRPISTLSSLGCSESAASHADTSTNISPRVFHRPAPWMSFAC